MILLVILMIPQSRLLTPKNVIVDLLRMTRQRSVSSKSLIDTGELFGFNANAIRVTLTRLVSSGILESDARGYYRLAKRTDPISSYIEDWRLGEERRKDWQTDEWLACHLPKKPQRAARSHSTKALKFLGFAEAQDNLWVRPANLNYPFAELEKLLKHLGLEDAALFMETKSINGKTSKRWQQQLWNTRGLKATYKEGLAKINTSLKNLAQLDSREAMAETFIVGGEAIHILVKDPWLPDEIFKTEDRTELFQAMMDYDEIGREIWTKEVAHLQIKAPAGHLRLVK